MKTAYFNGFHIELPDEAVTDCSHQGACDEDVAHWAGKLSLELNPDILRKELEQSGAWDDDELADHEANIRRIIWIAANNIKDEEYAQSNA
jgi:hypothetical protein